MTRLGSQPSASSRAGRAARLALALGLVPALSGAGSAAARAAPPVPSGAPASWAPAAPAQALAATELAEVDRMRRRGELGEAIATLEEVLADAPEDAASRALLARCLFDRCDYARAVEEGRRALEQAARGTASADPALLAGCARVLVDVLTELGRAGEALEVLEAARGALAPDRDARDAWVAGRALLEAGRREEATQMLRRGADAPETPGWEGLLAQGRCQRALGFLRRAASTLVAADRAATEASGRAEADVLVELGEAYFEAYGEVDDPVSKAHSPAELYNEALTLSSAHEGALLGLFELYRFNWMRSRYRPGELLQQVFAARRDSIPGLLAQASAALDDGELVAARGALERLDALAGGRRDVRTEAAALAWIEHRRDDCRAILDALAEADPADGRPEREVGRHLIELYRFEEARGFLERAVERAPRDWEAWTYFGRAQANTGDEESARRSLAKGVDVAEGRRNAWRDNTKLVLERMSTTMVEHDAGANSFAWLPDAAPIFELYLVPFYGEAREELAARYGFTPGPTHIEVFRKWEDFSVRSTGFEGFPALGVCFGPVVTAVSPLSQLRGSFSWARTSFHEYTHVIHLGLSHNRCPRWVTEGLATWEETRKNPAWDRNMRRDLLDARANGDVVPLRKLNNAFRGPGVLFAYYQSGLLCEMLIRDHGFPPMVRLLEAFDRGLDLDGAFRDVFDATPEDVESRFLAFVDEKLDGLAIEPRWDPARTFRLRFGLSRRPPDDAAERARWADDWCTVAWGFHFGGKRVDAEEALRLAATAGDLPPRGDFLRAELALQSGERDAARELYRAGIEAGGRDFRAFVALGRLSLEQGDTDEAEALFRAAEACFPGYPEVDLSAELSLAALHESRGDTAAAMDARARWLAYNAGDFDRRVRVARWLVAEGRAEEAVRYYAEANEVDPFRRFLHHAYGAALASVGRAEEALREFRAGALVPAGLDLDRVLAEQGDGDTPFDEAGDDAEAIVRRWDELGPELLGLQAETLLGLGRPDEAREAAEQALAVDPGEERALEVLRRSP